MNKETIEKAAEQYSYEQWKNEKDLECSDYMEVIAPPAFVAGAEWRINSVWHKPSVYGEVLTTGVEVIAKTKRGYCFGKIDVVGSSHEYIVFVSTSGIEYAFSDVLEYAYLDDLIPEGKEGQP